MKEIVFLVILALLFFLSSGCGETEKGEGDRQPDNLLTEVPESPESASDVAESPAYGDFLVRCATEDPLTLNPLHGNDLSSWIVQEYLYNRLVKPDENNNPAPDLCHQWEVKDKGKTIVFHLRQDVKWHDGAPFSSEDVIFTFHQIWGEGDQKRRGSMAFLDTLEVNDEYTLTARYKEEVFAPMYSWMFKIAPSHLLKGVDQENTDFNRNPVGSGPFRFLEWTAGERVVLEANPDYYAGKPFLNHYVLKIIPDKSTAFVSFLRGEVDLYRLSTDQCHKQADNEKFNQMYSIYSYPSRSIATISLNLRRDHLKPVNVRKALTMAIDRELIIKNAERGYADPCSGPYPPAGWAYDQSVKPLPYDIDKAKELLYKEGYKDQDKDGFVEKDGKPLEIEYTVCGGYRTGKLVAEIVCQGWEKIGVKVRLRPLSWKNVWQSAKKGDFEAVRINWIFGLDMDASETYHSSMVPAANNSNNGENVSAYSNPEVDALLDRIPSLKSRDAKKELTHKVHRLVHEDCPHIFLYSGHIIWGLSKRFRNVKPAAAGMMHNLEEWYVPEHLQKY